MCVCVSTVQSTTPGGHIICTVYLEEKKDTAEQHVKVTGLSLYDMLFIYMMCSVFHSQNKNSHVMTS